MVLEKVSTRTLLALIILVGTFLRFRGLSFGLPYFSNFYVRPDETLFTIPAIELFANNGDPKYFGYPALVTFFQALLMHSYWGLNKIVGNSPATSILEHFFLDTPTYWVLARVVSAVFGSLTIFLVYSLAGQFQSTGCALWAALLYSVSPLAVRDAHFAVSDTALTAFTTLTILQLLKMHKQQRLMPIAVGAAFGCAIASKYNAVFLSPIIGLSFLLVGEEPFSKKLTKLGLAVFSCSLLVVLFNPYLIVNIPQVIAAMGEISNVLYREAGAFTSRFLPPLTYGAGGSLGLLLAAIGTLFALTKVRRNFSLFILLGSLVCLIAPLIYTSYLPFRYVLPLFPILSTLQTYCLERCVKLSLKSVVGVSVIVLICISLYESSLISAKFTTHLTRSDTRSELWKFIERNVDKDTPLVVFSRPETEPQIIETEDSIRRRIQYVHNLYGAHAGNIVSRLYNAQLRSGHPAKMKRAGRAYSVYRNPNPEQLVAENAVVIFSYYPHQTAEVDKASLENFLRTRMIEKTIEFSPSLLPSEEFKKHDFQLDRVDAFYLPFYDLEKVERAGPAYIVYFTSISH